MSTIPAVEKRFRGGVMARLGAVLLLGLTVGACADLDEQEMYRRSHYGIWPQANVDPVQRNQLAWTPVPHRVTFAPRSSQISPEQRVALDQFLRQVNARPGEAVVVTIGSGETPGMNAMANRRIAAVRHYLASRRLVVDRVALVPATDDENIATVTVNRNVAAMPNCPDWQVMFNRGEMPWDRRQFGCMDGQTLGAIVENPNDLAKGRPLGRGDGPTFAKGVQDYRAGTPGGVTSQPGTSTTPGTAAK